MSRNFGPVRQVAYVVRDIESTMRHWIEGLGVGPFFLLRSMSAEGFHYRGAPSPLIISLAFSQTGSVQIELIQQHNDAPSLFKDFLDAGREGQHHLAFWTTTFDADLARHLAAGFSIIQSAAPGGVGNRNVFFPPKAILERS